MRFLLVILLCLSTFLPASAFAKCYSNAEAEAEQGIRIHSELMVIGLNCQHMTPRGQQNFYSQYRAFTQRHADLFSGYESTLVNYYNKNGGSAERKIHDLKTSFANNVSTQVATTRPDVFCSRNVQRLRDVSRMSRNELQQWASSASLNRPASQSVCR